MDFVVLGVSKESDTYHLGLLSVSQVGAVLWDQAPNLWDLMSAPGSVRTELNYRTPSWCWNVGQWEKIPHTW